MKKFGTSLYGYNKQDVYDFVKEVAKEYPGKTIDNIISQMEAIKKEIGVTKEICVARYGFFKEIKTDNK